MSRRAAKPSAPEGKPWAIYARLSKAAKQIDEDGIQVGDLEKVEYQVELCRTYAASRKLPVANEHVYIDPSLSAWKKGVRRPQWDRMMSAVERGDVAGILVYAVDRFTRRPKDLETLIELADVNGLSIEGPRSGLLDLTTATGRQQARWMALQAVTESDNTSERIKVTLARKMKAGKPMGGGRCYGFEVGGEIQRPKEAKIIREMAKRMLAKETLQSLAADLNRRGLTTVRGGQWTGANLGRLLDGHRYGGFVEHKGEIVATMPGKPILDRNTYNEVQATLASRRRGARPTGRFPLTGLLTCSTCQRSMNGAIQWKARVDGTHGREYRCPIQRGGCGRAILADPVEQRVGQHMIELLSKPENVAKIVAEDAHLSESRAAQQTQLDAVEERLTDLEVKYASGETIERAYLKAKPILMTQRARLLVELTTMTPAAAVATYDASAEWVTMNDEQRRATIRRYRVKIEILPRQHGSSRRFDPNRVRFPD